MNKKKENKTHTSRRLVKIYWLVVLLPFFLLTLSLLAANLGLFGKLPATEDLENPKSNLATEVFSADSVVLGKYFLQNRTNVRFEELSPYLVDALISTEDERYRSHSGIDIRSFLRAILSFGRNGGASTLSQQLSKMLFSERPKSKLQRISQKLKEWIIATRIEKQYTKNEIIAMYLNRFDFINNAVGIKSAAAVYFNKLPSELKVEEAALLVGMAKNPSLFNPMNEKRQALTLGRRNVVFHQMKRSGHLTQEAYDSLCALPVVLDYHIVDHKEGYAPYFREVLRGELKTMFEKKDSLTGEYLYHQADGSPYNIYSDGLKVYTTLDSRLQKYAEWAMAEHLKTELQAAFFKDLKKKKNAPFDYKTPEKNVEAILRYAMKRSQFYAVLSGRECANCGRRGSYLEKIVENGQGYYYCNAEDCHHKSHAYSEDSIDIIFNTPKPMQVFSWQGEMDTVMSPMDSIRYYKSFLQSGLMSVDPKTGYIKAWVGGINYNYFRYDHVKQSKRQVGSTIKPLVYCLAIKKRYSPCYEIPNSDVTIHRGQWGLDKDWTPNTPGFDFGGEVSLKYGLANSMNNVTAWIMKQFGPQAVVDFAKDMGITSPLKPVPSLCLGVEDVSLYEMVGALSTFANKGLWIKPSYISRIEDKNGNVIVDFFPESREVMTEEEAYVMTSLMKGTIDGVYNAYPPKNKVTGTAMRLRSPTEVRPYGGFKNPIAGKTGTTQNHSDGWFIGLTPDLVTGVWVGAEDPGVRFSTIRLGMGTNMALPIWGYYMQKVYADSTLRVSKGDFEKPKKRISIELDCSKYHSKSFDSGNSEPNFF
jgi:penicillin-binding protein 1A